MLQGELEGLKKALDGASSKAKELSSLAEKAGQVEGVSLRVNFIDRKQINLLYKRLYSNDIEKLKLQIENLEKAAEEAASTSAAEVEQLRSTVAEQEEKLVEADNERRKMHNIIQELRGNIRVYIRVRPFLSSDKGVDVRSTCLPVASSKRIKNTI